MTYTASTPTKRIFAATLGASLALATPALAEPGYRTTMLDVAHRDRAVELHIWYPTDATGTLETLGENAVFKGVSVLRNAEPAGGSHPMVLLSHGSGGNAANLAWIASELTERGMVVAAPNHPGTTSRDSVPLETVKVWERPADLSAIVDAALSTGFGDIQIDADAIAAVGFSLGGYTVLGIGGALVTKSAYVDYCDQYAAMHDCAWLASGGVDFNKIDQPHFEQSNRDPRIKAVVSIDPALSAAFTTESLAAMQIPVSLINLGVGADVPAAINAANLVENFANADLYQVPQATHFSFLGLCKRMGSTIVAAIGEDPICTEAGDRKRDDIHDELKARIGDFLARTLAKAS